MVTRQQKYGYPVVMAITPPGFRTGRADVSANLSNGEWQRNAVGRHRTLLNRQSFCAGLFVGTRVLLLKNRVMAFASKIVLAGLGSAKNQAF